MALILEILVEKHLDRFTVAFKIIKKLRESDQPSFLARHPKLVCHNGGGESRTFINFFVCQNRRNVSDLPPPKSSKFCHFHSAAWRSPQTFLFKLKVVSSLLFHVWLSWELSLVDLRTLFLTKLFSEGHGVDS